MKRILAMILLLLTQQGNAEQSLSPLSSIRVTGEATLHAKPDLVRIDIGVATQADKSAAAAAQNATRLTATLAALRPVVGSDGEIENLSYTLNPDYEESEGNAPRVKGYTASSFVRITLRNLVKVGDVVDTATRSGANYVSGVQFTLGDESALRTQALQEAARKARADADALAGALGLKVVRIMSVDESAGESPALRLFKRSAGAGGPPLEPSTVDITASVVLTVEVGPAPR